MDSPNPEVVAAPLSRSRTIAISRRVLGPIWMRVGFVAVLSVPGRRTGVSRELTLFPVEVEGTWYLMSHYGVTEWVRNLRAAGGGELRRKGRTRAFKAVEVDGAERDQAIAAFHARTPRPFSRDFDQRPDAADHPTFRVQPTS